MGIVVRACPHGSVRIAVALAAAALGAGGIGVAVAENQPPDVPVLVSPMNGTIAATPRPPLVILNATDPDGDPLVYDWDLATGADFAVLVRSGVDAAPQEGQQTAFQRTNRRIAERALPVATKLSHAGCGSCAFDFKIAT